MTDQAIEQEIQAKGLTAPRVTPADIEANIASEHCFTAADGVLGRNGERGSDRGCKELHLLTLCILVLHNGFTVTGESACASPENFDPELGRKIARTNAVSKIWPLMGYALKEQLASGADKAKQKPPYTWADVANHSIFHNNLTACVEFVIQTKGDDRKYQGSLPHGMTGSAFQKAAILECNRQRDSAEASH